jgi:hypothetical protein
MTTQNRYVYYEVITAVHMNCGFFWVSHRLEVIKFTDVLERNRHKYENVSIAATLVVVSAWIGDHSISQDVIIIGNVHVAPISFRIGADN